MPLFRCFNEKCADKPGGALGFDFSAPSPLCPKCAAGSTPRSVSLITPLVVVHFDPPTGRTGEGKNHLACNPAKPVAGNRATGVPDAVTCAACRVTEAFLKATAVEEEPVVEAVVTPPRAG